MFPVEVSCPKCGASLMDSNTPIEGFPSIHVMIDHQGKTGDLWLSSLYGSYRGKLEMSLSRGTEVVISCPACGEILSDGEPCAACEAATVSLEMARGGSIIFCSRFGCHKHSVAFGDLGRVVVASIMNRYIVNVYENDSVLTAAETMINYEVEGVPVLAEKETLIGLLTEERLLELSYPEAFGIDPESATDRLHTIDDWENVTCGRIADKDPITVSPETSLPEACAVMVKNHINTLLVAKEGVLVGVLTRRDLSQALLREKLG